jgi:hypothetical protein
VAADLRAADSGRLMSHTAAGRSTAALRDMSLERVFKPVICPIVISHAAGLHCWRRDLAVALGQRLEVVAPAQSDQWSLKTLSETNSPWYDRSSGKSKSHRRWYQK